MGWTVLAVWLGLLGSASGGLAQSESRWLRATYFIDVRARAERVDTGAGPVIETDAFVHLSRLALRGQLRPGLGFLVATGSDRNFEGLELWDAVLFLELSPSLVLDAGRVLLPFVRPSQQFSNDLQTPDLNRTAFLYPQGSTVKRRDEGLRVRGLLAAGTVDYRVAMTRGFSTDRGLPRLTGRVGVNGGRPEPGYVFPGVYLDGPAVLAAGVAFDLQPDVLQGGGAYRAVGLDAFGSVPRQNGRVTGQAAVVHYRGLNGTGPEGQPVVLDRSGVGVVADLGYLARSLGPVVAVEWFRPEGASALPEQLLAASAGLNAWLRGTATSAKLSAGMRKERGMPLSDAQPTMTLQLQTRVPLAGRRDR